MTKTTDKRDRRHSRNLTAYQRKVDAIYKAAATDAANLASLVHGLGDKPFAWADYPLAAAKMNELTQALVADITATVENGVRTEWTLSNEKNDALCDRVLGGKANLTNAQRKKYYNANGKALEAFLQRKEGGLDLSQRVWKYAGQFKEEMELALDLGIRGGKSADALSRDIRSYLREPQRLFRRVRDRHGALRLSQATKAYHPGRGVYRSSYKNARRLAATETNIAYRTADYLRWQDLDFVVGVRVVLSNNHPVDDICNDLSAPRGSEATKGSGCYPKDFKFTGWHPHCRCFAQSILKTEEEMAADTRRILDGEEPQAGSVNAVTSLPQGFTDWIKANEGRINAAKSLPYFLKDNRKAMNQALGVGDGVKTAAKQAASMTSAAKLLGVTADEPMTFAEADGMACNPNYNRGAKYKTNCQSTAVAYELRRRGLNVEAFGNSKVEWTVPRELSKRPEAAWLTKGGAIPPPNTVKAVLDETTLGAAMKEEGRYQLWFNWHGRSSGHVITAERLADGALRYYDAQNGKHAAAFLYDFRRLDAAKGVRVLKVDGLAPNEKILNGIVKAAKSKADAPRMTMEQILWWLENTQGGKSFLGDIEPYSDELLKRLKECGTKAQRNRLLESVARGGKAEVLNDNGKAFTTCYPGHRAMKGETWKNTKQMAADLNNGGISVCFLPERNDVVSADALIGVASEWWKLADFKCSQSIKPNTIALYLTHAFEQSECCVIKTTAADKGVVCDALDYLKRNNAEMGDIIFVNKSGKHKTITRTDIKYGRHQRLLKGFFK